MRTNRTPLQNILHQFIVGGTLSDDRRMLEPRICLIISISFYWTTFFFLPTRRPLHPSEMHDGVDFACGHRPNLLAHTFSYINSNETATVFVQSFSSNIEVCYFATEKMKIAIVSMWKCRTFFHVREHSSMENSSSTRNDDWKYSGTKSMGRHLNAIERRNVVFNHFQFDIHFTLCSVAANTNHFHNDQLVHG